MPASRQKMSQCFKTATSELMIVQSYFFLFSKFEKKLHKNRMIQLQDCNTKIILNYQNHSQNIK
jgi:hypothetical protein